MPTPRTPIDLETRGGVRGREEFPAGLPGNAPWRMVAALLLALTVFGVVQTASPHPVGVDGLFHAQSANLIRENLPRPWMPEFRWLELTSLRHDRFADFYWGFHLLLLPFTVFQVEVAAKLAPVVIASLSMMALYFVLGRFGVRYRLTWFAIALLASPIFLMRLSQNKASTAMLGLLLLLTWALIEKRAVWIAILGAAATWVYPVLPLIGAVGGAGIVSLAIGERRVPWKATASLIVGIAAGLLIHPDVPRNLQFLLVNLTEATRLQAGEFKPLPTDAFLKDLWVLAVLFLLAFRAAQLLRKQPRSRIDRTLLLVAGVMVLVAVRYMRGIDFVPPFVVAFAAVSLDGSLGEWVQRGRGVAPTGLARWAAVAGLAAAVLVAGSFQGFRARQVVVGNSTAVAHRLEGAASWLASNTAPGELVLNLTAGDFEQLWAYNTHNTYFVGFNVRFLQRQSPEVFREYASLYERGDVGALERLLTDYTTARFAVISDRLPRPLVDRIMGSPSFETVYSDRSSAIIRTR
jgi:hypothetical protein